MYSIYYYFRHISRYYPNSCCSFLFFTIYQKASRAILNRLEPVPLVFMNLLSVNNINLSRGERTVLSGLSLWAEPEDRIVVQGENGSGKTTLLKAILGLLPLQSGEISLAGCTVGSRSWLPLRNKVAWVPQDGLLHRFPVAAEEVVAVGLAGHRMKRRERQKQIAEAMERSGASHLEGRCYHRLSGGERQRISIARCLAQRAELLLLDEPAAALDAESRDRLVTLIERLDGVAVIVVTHEDALFNDNEWQHRLLEGGKLC